MKLTAIVFALVSQALFPTPQKAAKEIFMPAPSIRPLEMKFKHPLLSSTLP